MIAVLEGGPRDGHTDDVIAPVPQLVAVAWCRRCRRDHLQDALAPEPDVDVEFEPTYLLDYIEPGPPGPPTAIYRWVDVDAVDHLIASELTAHFPTPV